MSSAAENTTPKWVWFAYLVVGVLFGVILTKAELVSWFRIQEMFRFQGFHMYGVMGSGVATGAISLAVLKRLQLRAASGRPVELPPKEMGRGYRVAIGGTLFGLGWGLTGVCPGPMFALLGNGVSVVVVVFASALLGTWVYGQVSEYLPH